MFALHDLIDRRPFGLRARFRREVDRALARSVATRAPIAEADLAPLPALVQTYLRRVGVVGSPHVHSVRAELRGKMRTSERAPWMNLTAEQYNFFDEPSRLFYMHATRGVVPFDAFHRYVGEHATFVVRVAGVVPMLDAHGPEMDQSETVTMLNDLCFLAPAALVDAPIVWDVVGDRTVLATFTNAGHTVCAELAFDDAGDLVGFVSHDRYQGDGKTTRLVPWSTPILAYGEIDGRRTWTVAETRWHETAGPWTYGHFELASLTYNVGPRRAN